MTPERIKEIQAMLDAATPGPWAMRQDASSEPGEGFWIDSKIPHVTVGLLEWAGSTERELIAAAPTLIAELLAEVERSHEEIRELDLACDQLRDDLTAHDDEKYDAMMALYSQFNGGR